MLCGISYNAARSRGRPEAKSAPRRRSGRSAVRLARTVRVREVRSSNLRAPTVNHPAGFSSQPGDFSVKFPAAPDSDLFPGRSPRQRQQIYPHRTAIQRHEFPTRVRQCHFARRAAGAVHYQIDFDPINAHPHRTHHIQRDQRHPKRRMKHFLQRSADISFGDHQAGYRMLQCACEWPGLKSCRRCKSACAWHESLVQRNSARRCMRLAPGPIHDHRHTNQTDQPADQVKCVRRLAIDLPSPQQR